MNTTHRKEHDYLGEVDIPVDRLFGVNTRRGVDNLSISPRTVGSNAAFRIAFAQCKWAAALANFDHHVISQTQKDAIAAACAEIVGGLHVDSLVVDLLEGVAGISANRAANEGNLMQSMAVATALVPRLGHHKISAMVRQSVAEGRPLIDILEESDVLSRAEARALIEAAVTPAF